MRRVKKKFRDVGRRTGTGIRCWYCGVKVTRQKASRDHQTPRVNGGTSEAFNIVLACKPCNQRKDDMEVEAYRALLEYDLPAGERVVFYGESIENDSFVRLA